jgi:lipopolysaccharide biosynthesis protein
MKPRLIAIYLPQFYPIPENDEWWGKGFTEWTNVAKAKPMFRGHYQPHIPADLGFYDLRVPETRIAQANMAREYGIEAFCYYHYWFAGRRILERPFKEVLASGEPDFPFCLCWANQSWTGIWHGLSNKTLIHQTYPGSEDHRAHFETLLPAFRDNRYVSVDGKPLFMIYDPLNISDLKNVIEFWRDMAHKSGLPGLHLVANMYRRDFRYEQFGFDAAVCHFMPPVRSSVDLKKKPFLRLKFKIDSLRRLPTIYNYEDIMYQVIGLQRNGFVHYPLLVPNWDNTPRSGVNGRVFHGSTPELFRFQIDRALKIVEKHKPKHRIIFIKSWNEWAEGNYLEPDLKFGHGYLEALRDGLACQEA